MLRSYYRKEGREAGCDEAGRGCLAGPVFAAAVLLPEGFDHPSLDDSKKLTEVRRENARRAIEEHALSWAVSKADPAEIDEINILQASLLAMHRAIANLSPVPDRLLIDGHYFSAYANIPHFCIVKGDGKFRSIAAASILAKTHRDEFMCQLAEEFPQYGWNSNKGYPTVSHRRALRECGPSPHHRHSFKLLPDEHQKSLF
ncbi:MAG: ribonuclease HII [Saprospiraceae bacterium]|nr:ribonuclease HII [Saprospiraceae bacterium]